MAGKLFDSDLRVLDILWQEGDTAAKKVAEILREQVGWSKTTTYTIIKRCIDKGVLERLEPNFICRPLISKKQAQEMETTELINKLYGGAADALMVSLLGSKRLSAQELERMKRLVNELE